MCYMLAIQPNSHIVNGFVVVVVVVVDGAAESASIFNIKMHVIYTDTHIIPSTLIIFVLRTVWIV